MTPNLKLPKPVSDLGFWDLWKTWTLWITGCAFAYYSLAVLLHFFFHNPEGAKLGFIGLAISRGWWAIPMGLSLGLGFTLAAVFSLVVWLVQKRSISFFWSHTQTRMLGLWLSVGFGLLAAVIVDVLQH